MLFDKRILLRAGLALAVALLAGSLRYLAMTRLPVDYDEPVYYNAAQGYAAALRSGDWAALPDADPNYEHPGLFKLLYGAVLAPLPPGEPAPVEPSLVFDPSILARLYTMRSLSALFGTLNALLVALASPAAGLLLAVHTAAIRYSAQAYLEALPMLLSTASVLAYMKSRREPNGWLALSAAALGLTAASKYVHAVAGVAIALDWLLHAARPGAGEGPGRRRLPRTLGLLLGWGALSLVVFAAANPFLWPDPVGRVGESLALLTSRAQTEHVQSFEYGGLHLLAWMLTPVGLRAGAIITPLDTVTAVLGMVGFPRTWRECRVLALWWAVALAFLLVWTARLPHYVVVMVVPMAFCAAEGLRVAGDRVRRARTPTP